MRVGRRRDGGSGVGCDAGAELDDRDRSSGLATGRRRVGEQRRHPPPRRRRLRVRRMAVHTAATARECRVRVRVTGEDGPSPTGASPAQCPRDNLTTDEWQGRLIGAAGPAAEAQPVLLRRDFTVESDLVRAVFYRHRPGRLRRGPQRLDDRRRPVESRLDELSAPAPVRRRRRHASGRNRVERPDRRSRRRFVHGGLRVLRPCAPGLRRPAVVRRTTRARVRERRRAGDRQRLRVVGDHRGAPRVSAVSMPESTSTRVDPSPNSTTSRGLRCARTPAMPIPRPRSSEPVRESRNWRSSPTHLPIRKDHPRLRPEPGRPAPHPGDGPAGRSSPSTCRGARGRRTRHRVRCGSPTATDTLHPRGDGIEEWEPRFTFHGFRYAEVTAGLATSTRATSTAVVLHTDMDRTGWFESLAPAAEPPARERRLGHARQLRLRPDRLPAARRTTRAGPATSRCSRRPRVSLRLRRRSSRRGSRIWRSIRRTRRRRAVRRSRRAARSRAIAAAAWGDAATVVPSVLHERFGDLGVLRRQYPSMRAWVERSPPRRERAALGGRVPVRRLARPDAPPDAPRAAPRPTPISWRRAYFCRSTMLVVGRPRILGRRRRCRRVRVARRARSAARSCPRSHAGGSHRVSDSTTAYALALEFGLAPTPQHRERVGERLAHLVRAGGYRISTGFVGTPADPGRPDRRRPRRSGRPAAAADPEYPRGCTP